jgi:signal peptidase I
MKRLIVPFLEIFEVLAAVVIAIYFIYGFIAQPFLVQGASMEPNFSSGDYLLVDELSYRLRPPARGEVVVFRNPANEAEFFIKRIIGLPHDEILINNGRLFINGQAVEETYLPSNIPLQDNLRLRLRNDEYFVMGDNRSQSYDSRSWGPLKQRELVGVVRLRFWPPQKIHAFSYPVNQ